MPKCSNFAINLRVVYLFDTRTYDSTTMVKDSDNIKIAVVGISGAGKSAVCSALQCLADAEESRLFFEEVHDLDMLHSHSYHLVLQVVDARRLEESLMQTPHIIDEQEKIVLAIGHYDQLLQTDHCLDIPLFSDLIGVPVESISVTKNIGIDKLFSLVKETLLRRISEAHPVYHAWKQDDEAAYRAYVHGVLTQTLHHSDHDTHTRLEKIDKVLTNPWIGFPVMFLILYLVFECTFSLGAYPQGWIEQGIEWLCNRLREIMSEGWLSSLIIDGIFQGVGAVLSFLPNIIILFFFISIMEETGYMAREAYLMDGIMHRVGLHGRSFIPMLIGFGCNVPAIMAARDIKDPRDRTLTMLMVPFMSCSARLPVYMMFVDAFFPRYKALVMMSMYVIGVALSILFALIMKHTPWLRKPQDDSVNELPDFILPNWRRVGERVWERCKDYLQKITTVILWASIILWTLEYFPTQDLETSWLASIGKFLEPLFRPLGFDWKMAVCLITGLPAKEAIVSTMAILYGGDLTATAFTPLTAYSFMLFVLLYFPCVATVSTLRKETNWRWAAFLVIHSLLLAWLVAFGVYQIGKLI